MSREAIAGAQDEVVATRRAVVAAQDDHYKALRELKRLVASEVGLERVTLGGWDCPDSPTGACVYNPADDPALDDCVFCHLPEERK